MLPFICHPREMPSFRSTIRCVSRRCKGVKKREEDEEETEEGNRRNGKGTRVHREIKSPAMARTLFLRTTTSA